MSFAFYLSPSRERHAAIYRHFSPPRVLCCFQDETAGIGLMKLTAGSPVAGSSRCQYANCAAGITPANASKLVTLSEPIDDFVTPDPASNTSWLLTHVAN